MTEAVFHDFRRSFECRLPHVAAWPRSRVRRGVFKHPPPGPARSVPSSGPARVKKITCDHVLISFAESDMLAFFGLVRIINTGCLGTVYIKHAWFEQTIKIQRVYPSVYVLNWCHWTYENTITQHLTATYQRHSIIFQPGALRSILWGFTNAGEIHGSPE